MLLELVARVKKNTGTHMKAVLTDSPRETEERERKRRKRDREKEKQLLGETTNTCVVAEVEKGRGY